MRRQSSRELTAFSAGVGGSADAILSKWIGYDPTAGTPVGDAIGPYRLRTGNVQTDQPTASLTLDNDRILIVWHEASAAYATIVKVREPHVATSIVYTVEGIVTSIDLHLLSDGRVLMTGIGNSKPKAKVLRIAGTEIDGSAGTISLDGAGVPAVTNYMGSALLADDRIAVFAIDNSAANGGFFTASRTVDNWENDGNFVAVATPYAHRGQGYMARVVQITGGFAAIVPTFVSPTRHVKILSAELAGNVITPAYTTLGAETNALSNFGDNMAFSQIGKDRLLFVGRPGGAVLSAVVLDLTPEGFTRGTTASIDLASLGIGTDGTLATVSRLGKMVLATLRHGASTADGTLVIFNVEEEGLGLTSWGARRIPLAIGSVSLDDVHTAILPGGALLSVVRASGSLDFAAHITAGA